MDDNDEADGSGSTSAALLDEPSEIAVEQKFIPIRAAHRTVLSCRHNRSTAHQSLSLGSIKLGRSSTDVGQLVLGDSEQLYFETPIPKDNLIWVYTRKSAKKSRTRKSRAQNGLVSVMAVKPSHRASALLQYPPEAFSSCGFEIRWSIDKEKLLLHIYLKKAVVKDISIVQRAAEIRTLVRGGFNRCANTILALVYPQFSKVLRKYSSLWVGDSVDKKRENFDEFFKAVRDNRKKPPFYQLRLDGLSTTLIPFQKDAVNFMIDREVSTPVDRGDILSTVALPGYNDIHYFPCFGIFMRCTNSQVLFKDEIKGGILADEMGLGKTVELLALILTNKGESPKLTSSEGSQTESTSSAEPGSILDNDVLATIELLVSSVVATIDTEHLQPPKKRFRNKSRGSRRTRSANVSCTLCKTKHCMQEVHWSQEYEKKGYVFTCPQCIEDNNMDFEVSATLIIIPESLLHQWFEEIRRHLKEEVVVDIYYGVAAEGYKHPVYMNNCDIILSTYETLQKEIFYVPFDGSTRELRKRPKSANQKYPSPLLAASFHRICLDESQLVESKVKAAAKMCSLLRARHHWCVTGTPLSKSVNDLYGLLCFLELFPYYIDSVWEHYVFNPWTADKKKVMVNLMTQLLWRNSKQDVGDQLDNVVRKNCLIELSFSPIEERLYSGKIEKSKEKMRVLLDSLLRRNDPDTPLSSLPSASVDAIFAIINDVRISILAGESHKHKKDLNCISDFRMFSPKLIFRKLFEDARTAVVQRHREMVANRNALAGIYLLLGEYHHALSWYKQAFTIREQQRELNKLLGLTEVINENKEELKEEPEEDEVVEVKHETQEDDKELDESKPVKPLEIDALQIIHITRNLQELAKKYEGAKKFVEANDIVQLEEQYHRRYVRNESAKVSRIKGKWCELDSKWMEVDHKFDASRMSYAVMLDSLHGTCAYKEFEATVPFFRKSGSETPLTSFEFLLSYDEEIITLRRSFTDLRRMLVQMLMPFQPKTNDDGLVIEETIIPPRSDLVEFTDLLACNHNIWYPMESVDGLPNVPDCFAFPSVNTCTRCKVEALMSQISLNLSRRGKAWHELILIRMYRSCNSEVMKVVHPFYEFLLKWLTLMEKMLRIGREITTYVQEWVNRERELVMGATRFQFGMNISIPYLPRPLVLSKETLDIPIAIYGRSETVSAKALSSSLSALRYLNTLQRENQTHPETVRECPCCYMELNEIWIVFPCAHIVCVACMKKLKSMPSLPNKVRCITCRQVFPVDATMYVVDKKDELIPGVRLTVKFEMIIRHLKKLIEEDGTNKILLFTSISAAIPPFAALLKLLNLPYLVLEHGSKSKILNKFRTDPQIKILVLPLRMGANGLNLTQANHVVFMEPITETSVFAQAVGRIDRIGQRRNITVHNFIVKGSIEEEIYGIVNKGTEQSKWTLNTLRQVFGIESSHDDSDDVLLEEL